MIPHQLSRPPRGLPIRGEVNAFAQPSAAPVAGPQLDNRRVLAALVDLVVIFAGGFVLGMITAAVNGTDAEWGGSMQAISLAWALYYYFAFESGAGQTLGKKLLKLRVVRADGGPAGMRDIAVRTVLRVIDGLFLYLVGLIVMLVTGERRQRLGDLAAGTVVADATTTPVPQVTAATAAPPAAATPEGLEDPEVPADAEPREKTPVDVGAPLEGLTQPRPTHTPELTDFEPFSTPADEHEDLMQPQDAGEAEGFEEPVSPGEPHGYGEAQGPVESEGPDESETLGEPEGFEEPPTSPEPEGFGEPEAEPALEPADTEPVEPESGVGQEERTEWPHMYASRPSRAYEAEMALSPQPQEPHIGDTAGGDATGFEAPEEAVEDLQADGARAIEGRDSQEVSEVPGLAGAPVEEPKVDHPAPAAQEPTSGLVADEPLADAPGDETQVSPAEAADAADAPAADAPEEAPPADEDVTVKPIETVSAIDLVMGSDEEEEQPERSDTTEPSDPAQPSETSPGEDASGDEPDSPGDRPAGL
jgi:uncharacterized RDD family membrane protein YckC